jgi:hypothetical protein
VVFAASATRQRAVAADATLGREQLVIDHPPSEHSCAKGCRIGEGISARRRAAQSAHVQDARRQRSKGSSTPKSLADPFLYNEDASRCIGAPPGDVTLWRACDAKFEQLMPMQSKFSRRAAPTLHGAAGRRWISLTRRPLLHPSRRATSAGLCEQARQRPMAPGARATQA